MTLPLTVPTMQNLPREQRIAKRRDFLAIYETGRKDFGRHSVLFVRPNELGHPRLGITVTKKAGKAHVRNRLRRWCREVFRTMRTAAGLDPLGIDLVINVKPSAASATFAEFSADLTRLLRRSAGSRP
ncbi:MAG TPA: ribonuclease P protein component [Thermoanaerobaculia bacterium]|nr:ribonuclease P protein component [Thermoanaerobaculia bacterium]